MSTFYPTQPVFDGTDVHRPFVRHFPSCRGVNIEGLWMQWIK